MSELRIQSLLGPSESAVIQLVDQQLDVQQGPLTKGSDALFDVDEGSYLIQAMWADGQKTQQVIDVPPAGATVQMESPPPDTAAASTDAHPASAEQIVRTATRNSTLSMETAWKKPRQYRGGGASPVQAIRQSIEERFQQTGFVLQGPAQPSYALWRRDTNGWVDVAAQPDEESVLGGLKLQFTVDEHLHVVEIRSGDAKEYLSLPAEHSIVTLQWFDSGSAFYSYADARTLDDDVESLRGYIQRGELGVARLAAPEVMAERYLRSKMAAPRIAALGAYFLLRIGDLDRLHDWPDNLTNWQTWLPDGPVIAAWQRLRGDDPDYQEIFDLLMEAVDRGLPVYTEGVRLLKDGLELFGSDDERDWDVTGALNEIDRFGKAMHWGRSETTYFGDAPDEPRLGARQG